MDSKASQRSRVILVIILCISGAAFSLCLFFISLFQTFNSQDEPLGTVIVKQNIVQRRIVNRVLWDRLTRESPVYPGDVIRVADLSSAELHIGSNEIALEENTLIRIFESDGPSQIELNFGILSIITGNEGGDISLHIHGSHVEAGTGTVLSASAGDEGMILSVSEGRALFYERGMVREASAGTMISLDLEGNHRDIQAALVMSPRPNARLLKHGPDPLNIKFSWNRINLDPDENLNLEIALDRSFSRILMYESAYEEADIDLDAGFWHWRLLYGEAVLHMGRVTVLEALPPVLFSPSEDQMFRYQSRQPQLSFRWSEIEGASYYLLEAGETPDFENPIITTNVQGTSFVNSGFGPGTWYWRVRPVYTFAYDASGTTSETSTFHIEQTDQLDALVLRRPTQGTTVDISQDRRDLFFSWENTNEAESYIIQISESEDLNNPVISGNMRDNFFVYSRDEEDLHTGQYYWSVTYSDQEGNQSPPAPIMSFIAMEGEVVHVPIFPPEGYTMNVAELSETSFTWNTNLPFERRFQVSRDSAFSFPEIDVEVTGESFQGLSLDPGSWYWRIYAKDAERDYLEFATPARRLDLFQILAAPVLQELALDNHVLLMSGTPFEFNWSPVNGADQYLFSLYSTANSEQPVYEQYLTETFHTLLIENFGEGSYFWTVQAIAPDGSALRTGNPGSDQFDLRIIRNLSLESPAQWTSLPGLTALREQTLFRWNSTEVIANSRFVLSRNSNPSLEPEFEIINPDPIVSIEGLGEGIWYWTVEAETQEGFNISAASPIQLWVMPIPLLPEAQNRYPDEGHNFHQDELRTNRTIDFSWSPVQGANTYIFSIFQETDGGRREILRNNLSNQTSFTLMDLSILDPGTFVWQLEALSVDENGNPEQQGRIVENSFIMDILLPGPVQTEDPGILYGN